MIGKQAAITRLFLFYYIYTVKITKKYEKNILNAFGSDNKQFTSLRSAYWLGKPGDVKTIKKTHTYCCFRRA